MQVAAAWGGGPLKADEGRELAGLIMALRRLRDTRPDRACQRVLPLERIVARDVAPPQVA